MQANLSEQPPVENIPDENGIACDQQGLLLIRVVALAPYPGRPKALAETSCMRDPRPMKPSERTRNL